MAAPLKKVLDSAVRIDPAIITSPALTDLEEINPKALHFIILVNQLVYQNSYFVLISADQKEQLCRDLLMSIEDLDLLLVQSCKKGFFNLYMYTMFGVLTNMETQEFWLSKVRRRKNVKIYSKFLLIDKELVRRYIVNNPEWIDEAEPASIPTIPLPKAQAKKENQVPFVPYILEEPPKVPDPEEPEPGHKVTMTAKELKEFIKKPYSEQKDLFKSNYTQKWFENYVEFAQGMISKGPALLISDNQISIFDYVKIVNELFPKYKYENKEYLEIIDNILGSEPLKPGSQMYYRFMQFSKSYVRDNFKPKKKVITPPENILHDGTKK